MKYSRQQVHLALGKTAEAVTDYSMALEIDPADSALYNGRGFALTQTDPPDLQAALINVDQAIQLEETNGAAHCTRGYIGKKLAEQHTPHSPEWERLVDDAIGPGPPGAFKRP
jgi:lipoprotein NlpI